MKEIIFTLNVKCVNVQLVASDIYHYQGKLHVQWLLTPVNAHIVLSNKCENISAKVKLNNVASDIDVVNYIDGKVALAVVENTAVKIPAAVRQAGKHVFNFQTGEKLTAEDYIPAGRPYSVKTCALYGSTLAAGFALFALSSIVRADDRSCQEYIPDTIFRPLSQL